MKIIKVEPNPGLRIETESALFYRYNRHAWTRWCDSEGREVDVSDMMVVELERAYQTYLWENTTVGREQF